MKITASVRSMEGRHVVAIQTDGEPRTLEIPPASSGRGSSVNGEELLLLALATCYLNDLHREAKKRLVPVRSVEVTAHGEFKSEGAPGRHFTYSVKVVADASEDEIRTLMAYVDTIAEVQNTLRASAPVRLLHMEAERGT